MMATPVTSFGWEGEKVRLVPLDKGRHFENCVRWLNDPLVTQWTLIGDFPLSRVAEEEFFERMTYQNQTDVAFETLEEEHIGVSGIHRIDFRDGTATTGSLIGRRQLWSRGYGSDAIAIRTRYAFNVLGLRRRLAEVLAENIAALKALAKSGYGEVGRVPARRWKRGAYRDEVLLATWREDWAARSAKPAAE